MDKSPQTSFIPKKPIVSDTHHSVRGMSIVTFFSVLVFIASFVYFVGSYLYQGILQTTLDNDKKTLETNKNAFDLSVVADLKRLSNRLYYSKNLLDNHISLTPFFDTLEKTTSQNVEFTSFSFVNGAVAGSKANQVGIGNTVKIEMDGQARSYASVAFQSTVLSKINWIKNAVFSDLNLDPSGNVVFKFKADLDPSVLRYEPTMQDNSQSGSVIPVADASQPVSSSSGNQGSPQKSSVPAQSGGSAAPSTYAPNTQN